MNLFFIYLIASALFSQASIITRLRSLLYDFSLPQHSEEVLYIYHFYAIGFTGHLVK